MSPPLFSTRPEARPGGFRVAAPRLGETVSGALLSAYARDRMLPDDMLDLLAKLDTVELPH